MTFFFRWTEPSVIGLKPPGLRERREDIPLLAEHVIAKLKSLGIEIPTTDGRSRK